MQYEITLPADYDMGIIRNRVARIGHALDDRTGLGAKAYCIRERGVAGSPVNQYAPWYLWLDPAAMGHFLVGNGGFQNIVRDFGRPVVEHWTGLACRPGPAGSGQPRSASRRIESIPAGADPAGAVAAAVADLDRLSARDGVHTVALAVDPRHWQLVRFTLWAPPLAEATAAVREDGATERYELLHLSAPGLADLTAGGPVPS